VLLCSGLPAEPACNRASTDQFVVTSTPAASTATRSVTLTATATSDITQTNTVTYDIYSTVTSKSCPHVKSSTLTGSSSHGDEVHVHA